MFSRSAFLVKKFAEVKLNVEPLLRAENRGIQLHRDFLPLQHHSMSPEPRSWESLGMNFTGVNCCFALRSA
jgi:hypothetical protein